MDGDQNNHRSKTEIAGAIVLSVAAESGRIAKMVGFKSKWFALFTALATSVGVVLLQDDASLPVMPNSSVIFSEPAVFHT